MEEKKQELVIKITNRVIEVKLEDGISPGLFLLALFYDCEVVFATNFSRLSLIYWLSDFPSFKAL